MATLVNTITPGGTRYKGKQINVPQPESLAKNTLDATHKSRIKHFKDEKRSLTSKKNELAELERLIQSIKQVDPMKRDYDLLNRTEDRVEKLKKEIDYIESGKAELEYFSKAGELLIEFYDNVNASKNKGKGKGKKKNMAAPGKSVYDLFMQPSMSESVQNHIAEQRMFEGSNYESSNYDPRENDDESPSEIVPTPSNISSWGNSHTSSGIASLTPSGVASLTPSGVASLTPSGIASLTPSGVASLTPSGIVSPTSEEFPSSNRIEDLSEKEIEKESEEVTKQTEKVEKTEKAEKAEIKPAKFHKLTNFVEKQEGFKRADFFGEYLTIIDPHHVIEEDPNAKETSNDTFCHDCGCYRDINPNDATMVCPKCCTYVVIVIDSDKPNYKDPPAEISNFPYRRINHFNECLSQFQAKESTEIPQIVYDIILMEMKKERLTNMSQLTREKVHTYLKKQANKKFTNYYEHIPHIIHRLTGIQPKTMTPKMEEELRRDFHKIQEPYAKHKPRNRKNFLNYNYVLHKLCQIRSINDREYKEFLTCFPLLKSRDKLLQQDIVWKKICLDLEWKFIKSV